MIMPNSNVDIFIEDVLRSAINRHGGRTVNRGERLGPVWHDAAMLPI
jgi:hypothetical protein